MGTKFNFIKLNWIDLYVSFLLEIILLSLLDYCLFFFLTELLIFITRKKFRHSVQLLYKWTTWPRSWHDQVSKFNELYFPMQIYFDRNVE